MDEVVPSLFWFRVASRHGLLTWREGVAEFGVNNFKTRIANGQFVRVHRGVYRVQGTPVTDRQVLLGAALALDAYASTRSTLALHGVAGVTLVRPEVTRTGRAGFTRAFGKLKVNVHWSNFLPEHHLTIIDGIPSTTLVRALCDASSVMSVYRLGTAVDECARRNLIDYGELAECREEMRARGRRKTTFLDLVLEDRVAGYTLGESAPEDKVRKWLVDAGYEPVAQHWVVANGRRRRIDLALIDNRVAVEYQGLREHGTPSAVVHDSEKVTDLQLAGWFVALVTKKTTRAEFIRTIRDAIQRQGRAS